MGDLLKLLCYVDESGYATSNENKSEKNLLAGAILAGSTSSLYNSVKKAMENIPEAKNGILEIPKLPKSIRELARKRCFKALSSLDRTLSINDTALHASQIGRKDLVWCDFLFELNDLQYKENTSSEEKKMIRDFFVSIGIEKDARSSIFSYRDSVKKFRNSTKDKVIHYISENIDSIAFLQSQQNYSNQDEEYERHLVQFLCGIVVNAYKSWKQSIFTDVEVRIVISERNYRNKIDIKSNQPKQLKIFRLGNIKQQMDSSLASLDMSNDFRSFCKKVEIITKKSLHNRQAETQEFIVPTKLEKGRICFLQNKQTLEERRLFLENIQPYEESLLCFADFICNALYTKRCIHTIKSKVALEISEPQHSYFLATNALSMVDLAPIHSVDSLTIQRKNTSSVIHKIESFANIVMQKPFSYVFSLLVLLTATYSFFYHEYPKSSGNKTIEKSSQIKQKFDLIEQYMAEQQEQMSMMWKVISDNRLHHQHASNEKHLLRNQKKVERIWKALKTKERNLLKQQKQIEVIWKIISSNEFRREQKSSKMQSLEKILAKQQKQIEVIWKVLSSNQFHASSHYNGPNFWTRNEES